MRTKLDIFMILLIWGMISLVVISVDAGTDIITIKVFKKSEITKDEIYLNDISEFKGNNQTLIQNLEHIDLGSAPLAGETKAIDRDIITIRLKQNHIDLSRIQLIVPKQAVALRKSMTVSTEEIKKIILDFLSQTLHWDPERVKVENIHIDKDVVLPHGRVSYKVVIPPKTEFLGKTSLSVDFSVNGRFFEKCWTTLDISVFSDVVAAKRPLGRYKIITEEDLIMVERDLADLPSDAIRSFDAVIGKRTKRMINAFAVLEPHLIELPPLVKRGSIVSIIAESDSLKVVALGKVKERGKKGELIKVENMDSNKCIYARVVDANNVMVDF